MSSSCAKTVFLLLIITDLSVREVSSKDDEDDVLCECRYVANIVLLCFCECVSSLFYPIFSSCVFPVFFRPKFECFSIKLQFWPNLTGGEKGEGAPRVYFPFSVVLIFM